MTAPTPGVDGPATALRRVTSTLDDAVAGIAVLVAHVGVSWPDGAGAGWAARLELLGRELARQAGVAGELAQVADALAGPLGGADLESGASTDRPGTPGGPAGSWPAPRVPTEGATGWSLPGVRLGGTDGARVSERRGPVVPTLPEAPG